MFPALSRMVAIVCALLFLRGGTGAREPQGSARSASDARHAVCLGAAARVEPMAAAGDRDAPRPRPA